MSNYQAEVPAASAAAVPVSTIAGHPTGLYILFFAELWERFSYYGMRALLVFYMTRQLLFPQEQASSIYGIYTGLVYLTPIFGGLLADRVIGQRRAVVIGGSLMAIGHFLMAFENLFFVALGFIIVGNGAFKPNISTQVGLLYAPGDPRRDRAFSIFYVGINLGAFLAPLICGTLGEKYGWHYGFAAAGVGMVCGLLVYLWGQKFLAQDVLSRTRAAGLTQVPLTAQEKKRVTGLIALCGLVIFFWATYEQSGNTIALWALENTNRNLFGNWEMPASWFQSINPFFIFTLTPVILALWGWQARRGQEPSTISKMAIGCFLVGVAFVVMIFAAQTFAATGSTSAWWLIGFFFFLTVGELFVSPVGLSLVSKVAPPRMVSLLMGCWFLATFAGNYLAGYLGTYWQKMPKEGFFLLLTGICVATGVAIWAFNAPLKQAIDEKVGKAA